jgi:alpha-ketoglutarate-dependent taurine dioxygenase
MGNTNIEILPMTPTIGAEIHGADLTRDLGNQTFQEIHDALMEHQVLFFRNQEMDLDQHKAFGRLFGQLQIHPASPGPEGHPEIVVIHADGDTNRSAGRTWQSTQWHTDVSCMREPPMGSVLHLNTVPPVGGDTLFASMYAAYEALSAPMKTYLENLTATHDGERVWRGRYTDQGVDDSGRVFPRAVHPVIRTHPITGRKGIFVNSPFTTHINEIPQDESDDILAFLYKLCANPAFQVRFRWQPNSVAFWDNRCVQHLALWDYFPETRSGYRVTMEGDQPI